MKSALVCLVSALMITVSYACEPNKTKVDEKQVCITVLNNKTNKEEQKCKKMKLHEKKEGTAVPIK